MTPEERNAALETERELAVSVLRFNAAVERMRIASAVVQAPCYGATALLVRWHAWPWLPLPLAAALAAGFASVAVQRRAQARHRRTCARLGAGPPARTR